MANTFSDDEFREFHRIIQQAALVAYPNPQRVGCPGPTVLREVADTPLPFDHSAYGHVAKCSPCLREMLDFRAEFREHRKIRTKWIGVVAAATLIVVASCVYFVGFRTEGNSSQQVAIDRQEQQQPVKSIVLTANLLRGARASQPNTLTTPTPPANLRLLLNIETDAYPRYSAVLQTAAGKVVANLNGLGSVPIQTGRAVSIHVSSQLFQPGNYIVILRGEMPNAESQIVNVYELGVSK
jgi:hypothetical protein